MLSKLWQWVDYNRFTFILPIIGLVIWFAAIGCTPITENPLRPGAEVSAVELQTEFEVWQLQQQQVMLRFDAAKADLEKQQQAWNEFQQVLISLASGNVADWPGLLQLVLGGGLLGALSDNIRKRGLIAGLKRNKE